MHGPRCYTAIKCLSNSTDKYMNHSAQYPELLLASSPFFNALCWMCTKKPQRKTRGAGVIYLWIVSTTSKSGLRVRALVVDVARGGGPTSAAGPRDQPSFLHIRLLLKKKLLWHKGWFPSNTDVLIEKCWCLPVHSLDASVIISSTRYDSTTLITSGECVGYSLLSNKTINNLCSWNKKQSWKANGEHAQISLTFWYISYVVSPQSTQWAKSLVADFSTDKGASDGEFKPR